MSLFKELKRRNVFKIGIAYVVVSWLLLQVADIVFEAIGTPTWVMQTLLVILLLGLLLALFFAWAFELTPEGLKREKDVDRSQSITTRTGRKLDFAIIGLLAIALGYFIWESRFATRDAAPAGDVAASARLDAEPDAEPMPQRQSVAVLPFDNRSRLAEDEPFVEGVHDDLLTNLARIGSLKVISRTSVAQYRDTEKTIPQIAGELGVATVMEGAVQRSGNTVRINVQLIDAHTDEHLWGEIYDRELTAENLFAIQSEISEAIAGALKATLTDAEQDRINTMPTDNLAAYDAYTRGRQLMATRETVKLEEAAGEFLRAVELDPEFALAWVGVADSHDLWENYGTLGREESIAIRENAIERALAIDDELGEAHVSQAQLHVDRNQIQEAETAFRRAIDLSPNYATAYHWYSLLLGRYELRAQERVDLMRKAAELDPRSAIVGVALGGAYLDQGLYSRAERQFLDVLDMEPGFMNAMSLLNDLYQQTGRYAEAMVYARKAAERDPGSPVHLSSQAWIYLQLGEVEKAERLMMRIEEMDPGSIGNGFLNLWINNVRGNLDGAFEAANWLVPKMEQVGGDFYFMGFLNAVAGKPAEAREWFLRSDPRWMEPEAWRELIEEYDELGCMFSWLLLRTGEQELGERLLEDTTTYLTEELPAADEHADNSGVDLCHLTAGDTQAAYAVLETQLNHNHLGYWHQRTRLPMFEPIRHDERLNELLSEHDRRIAEQRELVAKLDEGLVL